MAESHKIKIQKKCHNIKIGLKCSFNGIDGIMQHQKVRSFANVTVISAPMQLRLIRSWALAARSPTRQRKWRPLLPLSPGCPSQQMFRRSCISTQRCSTETTNSDCMNRNSTSRILIIQVPGGQNRAPKRFTKKERWTARWPYTVSSTIVMFSRGVPRMSIGRTDIFLVVITCNFCSILLTRNAALTSKLRSTARPTTILQHALKVLPVCLYTCLGSSFITPVFFSARVCLLSLRNGYGTWWTNLCTSSR
eukprot:284814814_1